MTVVHFENILPQQKNRAFCLDRTLEGASERGFKLLPLAQYGRLKCAIVVQFERIQDPRPRSQTLTAGSVWEAEMCDSCAVSENPGTVTAESNSYRWLSMGS